MIRSEPVVRDLAVCCGKLDLQTGTVLKVFDDQAMDVAVRRKDIQSVAIDQGTINDQLWRR